MVKGALLFMHRISEGEGHAVISAIEQYAQIYDGMAAFSPTIPLKRSCVRGGCVVWKVGKADLHLFGLAQ